MRGPHDTPATGPKGCLGLLIILEVDESFLNFGLTSGHIHLKWFHHPLRDIQMVEVPETDLHVRLHCPQVIGVTQQVVIGQLINYLGVEQQALKRFIVLPAQLPEDPVGRSEHGP